MGGKPSNSSTEDVYPQLSFEPKKKRHGNSLVDWDKTPSHLRKDLVELGLYTEDGEPTKQRPGEG